MEFSKKYIKEKWQHAGFQRYFKNFSWMFSGRIFSLAVAFCINIYLARYLGPGNFGLFNYIINFVGLFGFVSSLGIESIANREIVKNHEQKDLIVGTSFYLKIFGSICAVLSIFIISKLTTSEPVTLLLIMLYSFNYIFSAFNVIDIYFQSQAMSKYSSLIYISTGVLSATLKILVIFFHSGIIWLVLISLLESVITAVGLVYIFIVKGHSLKKWGFNNKIARVILSDSWPIMISSVAWMIYMKIDQVMVKNMLGNEQAGVYAVAAKLSEFWYFVPSYICMSIFPAIINAKKTSIELYEKRLSKLYFFVFWLSFFVGVATIIFSKFVINKIFGNVYAGAIPVLQIYVWAGIAVSLMYVLYYYLVAENNTKINAYSAIIGAVINVFLNLILIPRYGIIGSAVATLISYVAVTVSVLLLEKEKTQLRLIFNSIINPKSLFSHQ